MEIGKVCKVLFIFGFNLILFSNVTSVNSYNEYSNNIYIFVTNFNDANLKANIKFNFYIVIENTTKDKIYCEITNNWFKKDGEIINKNSYNLFIFKDKEIFFENSSYYIFTGNLTKSFSLFGTNEIYPYDNYMLNITFKMYDINIYNKMNYPYDLRVWPGEWSQGSIKWFIIQKDNHTLLNLKFILNRVSNDKTYFQLFYPSFFFLLGFISIINNKYNSLKLRLYITLFLALSASLIYFFPQVPPKSGLNIVMIITIILVISIMMHFVNDVFIINYELKIYKDFFLPILTSLIIIVKTYSYYSGLKEYYWIDWYNLWFNMLTMIMTILTPTTLNLIIKKYLEAKKHNASNFL